MPGQPTADLLVGRIRCVAAGVADRRGVDPGQLPDDALGAPEATETEDRLLEPVREGRLERRPEHLVATRDRHALLAPGERLIGRDHPRRLSNQELHGTSVARSPLSIRIDILVPSTYDDDM